MSQGSSNIIIQQVQAQAGVLSTLNSSTSALTTLASFSGSWEDASTYSSIVIAAKTDQDGTYSIQFSPDASNIDSSLTRYYRINQIEPPHRFSITRKYARVIFTNSSTSNQTYFRLQTLYGNQPDLNVPLDSTIAQDYDSVSVRPTNYNYEVALGRRQGSTTWNKWGYNEDVDVGTETVWYQGGIFQSLTAASTLTIRSTDANDSITGTAASGIVIYGLDENRKSRTQAVTLSGLVPVITTSNWTGINRVALFGSNSAGAINVGDIILSATVNNTVQATIPAGEGTTQQAIFFNQADHQFLIDWLFINIVKPAGLNPIVTIKGWVTSFISNSKYEVLRIVMDTAVENTVELKPSQPFVVSEQSVFEVQATTDKADTHVSVRFSGIEIKDVDA